MTMSRQFVAASASRADGTCSAGKHGLVDGYDQSVP